MERSKNKTHIAEKKDSNLHSLWTRNVLLKLKMASVYAILACIHEMKVHGISQKHVSICSDRQAALKPLRGQNNFPFWFINAKKH
jgi:hypothetical protein